MGTTVKIEMQPTQKILLKRALNKNGKAQQFFTKEVAKHCEPYVPFKTGRLKDMSVSIGADQIKYSTPYAKRQYYTNLGNGIGGTNRGGLRGKLWDKRMWVNKGNEIVKSVANLCGGEAK